VGEKHVTNIYNHQQAMNMKPIKSLLLTAVCLLIYPACGIAVQRMGLLSGGSAHISAGGRGTLPTVCLDEHDDPPTTSSRYVNVMNGSSPHSVTVEIDGQKIPLQKALDEGLLSISGVSSPFGTEAYIDEVRINNLSGKPISVRVNEPAVLGATEHRSFDYDVTKLLKANADQDEVWRKQPQLSSQPRQQTPPPQSSPGGSAAKENIRKFSTPDMSVFHFSSQDGRTELQFADGTSVSLSTSEVVTLRSGQPLSADHPLSKRFSQDSTASHVLYSDSQLESSGAYVRERNAMAFGLQAAYPKSSIYRDPLSDKTSERAKKLSEFEVAGAKELLVVVPEDSARETQIQFQRTITNIRERLSQANVEIKQFKVGMVYDGKQGRAVFVITGHSSEQLVAFVRQVGEAGFFRDNYVVLNSCGVDPVPQLVNEINSKYGAVGTFSFQGEIRAAAVQNYLLDLVEKLKGIEPKKFVPLLIDSARCKGLFGIFTISKVTNDARTTLKEG